MALDCLFFNKYFPLHFRRRRRQAVKEKRAKWIFLLRPLSRLRHSSILSENPPPAKGYFKNGKFMDFSAPPRFTLGEIRINIK